jgi:hypothetical protein
VDALPCAHVACPVWECRTLDAIAAQLPVFIHGISPEPAYASCHGCLVFVQCAMAASISASLRANFRVSFVHAVLPSASRNGGQCTAAHVDLKILNPHSVPFGCRRLSLGALAAARYVAIVLDGEGETMIVRREAI